MDSNKLIDFYDDDEDQVDPLEDTFNHFEHAFDPLEVALECQKGSQSLGEMHYRNQFKNNEVKKRQRWRTIGNSLSMAGSRPSGWTQASSRIANKALSTDVKIHQICDYKTLNTLSQYSKNRLPSAVPYQPQQKLNHQEHNKYSGGFGSRSQRKVKRELKPRIVQLSTIHPNLYLGNLDSLSDLNINIEFETILNVSQKKIDSNAIKGKIYEIEYADSRVLTFQEFRQIMTISLELLEDNLDAKTLIVCEQGVNRSVSIAIAYAISKLGMTADQASNLIDEIKLEYDQNWNHLTNPKIRNLLNLFEQKPFLTYSKDD
jgi:protein-tyrosine phosphatase